MIIVNPAVIKKYEDGLYWLSVPDVYIPAIDQLCERSKGAAHVTIGYIRRTRSGKQNNLAHAWCRTIAGVLNLEVEEVYQAMKRMAVAVGYPTYLNPIDATECPVSSKLVSVQQYRLLLDTIWQFAGEHGIELGETYAEQA